MRLWLKILLQGLVLCMSINNPTLSLSSRAPQLPALTGLRFIAAFLVLFSHASHTLLCFKDVRFWYLLGDALTWTGMTLFFVLSGFVIHYNYKPLFETTRFAVAVYTFCAARFARLYPMFLFCFLLAFVFVPLTSFFPDKLFRLPFYLTLTQSWLCLLERDEIFFLSFYPHSWSISTEWFFYLLFPLIVFPIARLRHFSSALLATGLFTACAFFVLYLLPRSGSPLLRLTNLTNEQPLTAKQLELWLGYFNPFVRFLEFALGALVAQSYLAIRERPITAGERFLGRLALTASLIVLFVLHVLVLRPNLTGALAPHFQFLHRNFLYAPALGVAIFTLVRYDTWLTRLLDRPALVAVGEASYSIYLLQPWVLTLLQFQGNPTFTWALFAEWCLRMVMAMSVTIVFALGTYRCIEDPARRVLRRWLMRPLEGSSPSARLPVALSWAVYAVPALAILLGIGTYRGIALPRIYCHRGIEHQTKGELAAALADSTRALRIAPYSASIRLHRAQALALCGETTAALADYAQVLAAKPGHAQATFLRGTTLLTRGSLNEAIADFDCAIAADPLLAQAYFQRGSARQQLGQPAAAVADYDRAIELGHCLPQAFLERGRARVALEAPEAALKDFTCAINADPKLAAAYHERGLVRLRLEDRLGALVDFEQALQLAPHLEQARQQRNEILSILQAPG